MLGLLAIYAGFFLISPLREFFELAPLPLVDVAAIAAFAVAWAIVVMVLWRVRIVDRIRLRFQPATTG
jgi:cation-transporting ATPase E